GDPRAIELIRAANAGSEAPGSEAPGSEAPGSEAPASVVADGVTPSFLAAPPGARLCCALDPEAAAEAAALLEPTYWNQGVSSEDIAQAHLAASAWVGARDRAGRLVATARAL